MARCRMHLDVLAAATVAVSRTWAETNPLALAEFTQAYEQGQRIADTNRPAVERAMDRFNSRARAAQSGSTRRRWPVSTPARPNSRSSKASSVTSSASGHANPAAVARFRLSWIVDRATPRRRPISRALTPPW